jgi:hypothetical protein
MLAYFTCAVIGPMVALGAGTALSLLRGMVHFRRGGARAMAFVVRKPEGLWAYATGATEGLAAVAGCRGVMLLFGPWQAFPLFPLAILPLVASEIWQLAHTRRWVSTAAAAAQSRSGPLLPGGAGDVTSKVRGRILQRLTGTVAGALTAALFMLR